MRVFYITVGCSSPPSAHAETAGAPPPPATLLSRGGIPITLARLIPWWPGDCGRLVPCSSQTDAPDTVTRAAMDAHCLKWPVYPKPGARQPGDWWPGAGFAFPFVGEALVSILNARSHDILVADDLEFGGHVAWRLNEITGVPYVIICQEDHPSALDTLRVRQRASRQRLLQAIQTQAEIVVDRNTSNAAIRLSLFPGVRSRVCNTLRDTSSELVRILQEAANHAGETFDW